MKKISLENTELEYDIFRSSNKEYLNYINSNNENIILIHGGIMADANIPIITFSDLLIKDYNIIHYHRRGYGKSINKTNRPTTIFHHVEDCKKIMDLFGINKAHIVDIL